MSRIILVLFCSALATAPAAEPTLPVPSNLHIEGVPPIQAMLTERLDRYNDFRSAALLDWHPVKREILISTRFGDVAQIHRVAMPGGDRSQLTFFPDRTGSAEYRPGTGDTFVLSKDTGGAEFYQFYRFDSRTGDITMLTDGHSRNTSHRYSDNGHLLAYASTLRNGADTDIYVMDPDQPNSARRVLEVQGGGWFPAAWSPDGKYLVVEDRRSVHDSSLYLVEVSTGTKKLLTSDEGSYGNAQFARNGKGLYLTTDRGSEFERLAFLDLTTRELTFLDPAQHWDAEELSLTRDGRHLAYVLNEEGYSVLHVMDTATKRDRTLPALPRGVIFGLRWHPNG